MHRGDAGGKFNRAEVGDGTGLDGDGAGLVRDEGAVHVKDADADAKQRAADGIGRLVDNHEVEIGLVHHDVDLFASFARAEEGGEGFEVVAVSCQQVLGWAGLLIQVRAAVLPVKSWASRPS